jgi:multiple sugar transport system substrate-binding protein
MSKRVLGVLLGVVVSMSLVCGAGAADKVKLFHWTAYEENRGFYDHVISAFKKENPNIDIETETFIMQDLDKKLAVSIPSNTAADILDLISIHSFPYAEKFFAEVPAAVQKTVLDAINKDYLHDCMYDGKLLGVPYTFYSEVIYYNKTMFAEAGLPDRAPNTIDELVEFAKKLTKYDKDGNVTRSGLSMRLAGNPSGTTEKFQALGLFPQGADLLAPAKQKGKWHNGFNGEGGFKAVKLYIDLLYKHKVTDFNITQDYQALAQEKAAMLEREQSLVDYMVKNGPNVKYGAGMVPGQKQRGTFAITRNMFVPKSSKNQEAAWKFINFFYQKPFMEKLTKEEAWISTRKDIDYATLLKDKPQLWDASKGAKDLVYIWQKRIKPENEIMNRVGESLSLIFRDKSLVNDDAKIRREVARLAQMVDDILKQNGLYGE